MNRDDIERHILEGPTLKVALAVDTCIFEQHGLRLETGQLRHLEQFNATPGTVLMPDVVKREVLAHIVRTAVQAKSALKTALSDARDHWPASAAADTTLDDLLGIGERAEDVSSARLNAFLERCGATVVDAEGRVKVADVIESYFQAAAPFERSGGKKHEFPDALALMTLEHWAAENDKYVLLVSRDKGWQAVAETSGRMCCIGELDDALGLFQTRDATRTKLVEHVAALLDKEPWDGLDEVASHLNSTQWVEDASAMFDYEIDLQVEILSVKFVDDSAAQSLRAIDYSNGALTVIAEFEATAAVDATFSFIMDGVNLGGCVVSKGKTLTFEALITFEEPGGDELQAIDIELVRRIHKIDFGSVQPDYSDEDPTFEKY